MSKDFNLLHIAEGLEVPRDSRSQVTRPRPFVRDRDRDLHQRDLKFWSRDRDHASRPNIPDLQHTKSLRFITNPDCSKPDFHST